MAAARLPWPGQTATRSRSSFLSLIDPRVRSGRMSQGSKSHSQATGGLDGNSSGNCGSDSRFSAGQQLGRFSMKAIVRVQACLLLGVVVSVAWLTSVAMSPPAALPENAPAPQFSGRRAFAHVRAIAQKPRPTGSPENRRAREYILEQLTAFGLQPEIQQTTKQFKGRPVTLVNVMARIPGLDGSKAVALVGHRDSRPETPGAGDDA